MGKAKRLEQNLPVERERTGARLGSGGANLRQREPGGGSGNL